MLEVLVGLYGEGGGAGDGEGRRQPGSVGMGLSGCDEGLDGLEGRQEAAEEAAAPYRWETRVRSLLRWRRRVGLWRSGQECQAPLAASTKLAVDVETERCCTVLGARWQVLPMAIMHMAVWCASASGTEERPSSKDRVSWELGAWPAWKSVS